MKNRKYPPLKGWDCLIPFYGTGFKPVPKFDLKNPGLKAGVSPNIMKLIFSLILSMFILSNVAADEVNPSVLIVGSGPAGLAAAKALLNCGITPDLIEKEAETRFDGAGFCTPGNSSWALEKLGVAIAPPAIIVEEMQFTDDQGEFLTKASLTNLHPQGAQFYSLSREDILNCLLNALEGKVVIQSSKTVVDFREEGEHVYVTFSDGSAKAYDFVLGCDGIHSALRKKAHPEELSESLGLLVWRTVIEAPLPLDTPTYMVGGDRLIMFYPLPGGRTYLYGHLLNDGKSMEEISFKDAFSSFGGVVPQALAAFSYDQKFYTHMMEKSHSVRYKLDSFSRVLLLGDAAHAFGPMLQNGAAQAFEDAYVLQELMKEDLKKNIPGLIDAFVARRKARAELVFNFSNVKIQAISDPALIEGRNAAIKANGAPNVSGFKLLMQTNP